MAIQKQTSSMEQFANAKYDRQLESYEARYGKQFEAIAKSSAFKGRMTKNDMFTLGSQIDNYKKYEAFVNENSSASALGQLPRVAMDLISASYALSVAPQLASMQTIDEAQGVVYFKKAFTMGYPYTATEGLRALPNKGEIQVVNGQVVDPSDVARNGKDIAFRDWQHHKPGSSSYTDYTTASQNFDAVTADAKTGWQSSPTGYMSERQIKSFAVADGFDFADFGKGNGATGSVLDEVRWNMPITVRIGYTVTAGAGTASPTVVGRGFVEVLGVQPTAFGARTFYATDLGNNGLTVSATLTGSALAITLPESPTVGGNAVTFDTNATITYDVDFEKQPDVPAIEFSLTSEIVTAEIIGLKEMMGTFKSFQFNKRFGRTASDEVLADLSGHMAMAESEKVIAAYKAAAIENEKKPGSKAILWNSAKPMGISEFEHRQSLGFEIQAASAAIGARCGRGYANRIVGGYDACQYIASLPGFKAAGNSYQIGPHVFGTLDGITVIRSNTVVAPNEIICGYISEQSPFEAPVVCATYMPVFVTDTLPVSNNPFQQQRAIASWKAIQPVVPEFIQRIVIYRDEDAVKQTVVVAGN